MLATSRAHVFDMFTCICICAYTIRVRLEWMLLRILLMSVLQHELGRNDNLCTGKYSAYLYVRIKELLYVRTMTKVVSCLIISYLMFRI